MSIVLLQSGGLSKEQLDRLPITGNRVLRTLQGWVSALAGKPQYPSDSSGSEAPGPGHTTSA